jgi:hypothetical protein
LNNYVVTPAHDDKPAVMLSDAQKGTIANAFNAEAAKFGEESITKTSTYNGKIISDSELTTELINNTTSAKNSLQTAYNQLNTVNADIATKKASLVSEIQDLNDQKAYLNAHPLPSISIANSSVDFNDLISKPSKIEINGLLTNNITGNGNFKIFGSSIVVDNYSSRYLIFKNINLDNASGSGLIINGINYSSLANTGTKIGSGNVKLIRDYGSIDSELAGTVTVNNFFDYMNPSLTNAKPSNIVFNGSVINTNNAFNIFNDSGDIFFNNRISSSKLNAAASLGSISYKGGGNFNLLSNSRLIAGRDVSINANNIKIDGAVKAGNSDRNLTITNAMLSSLVVDPTTGETNMINLGGTEKSAYLNGTNNIKALYKDNKIILFNTESTSGSVNLNGTVTGSGTVTYSDGYGTVSVNNQTSKELVVNNLANNYGAGTFEIKDPLLPLK